MIGALVAGITGSGGASLSSFESIATATGTGSSGTITFSSIPSTFKHLQIRGIGRNSAGNVGGLLTFNSDTGANYASHVLYGDGTSATASGATAQNNIIFARPAASSSLTDVVGATITDILDYASTTKNKVTRSLMGVDNNEASSTYRVQIYSGLWLNTATITSISLVAGGSGNWTTQTTFALYGIKEA